MNWFAGCRSRRFGISAIALFTAAAVSAMVFDIERFKSITDFRILNRLTRETCSVPWDQEVPVCSDALADFTQLPFTRVFAAEIAVSAWSDLALHAIAIVPQECETFRVRHFLLASGVLTDARLTTQAIWLTDGGVYTVATAGLAVGDPLTLCVGAVSRRGPLRLASRFPDGPYARYTQVFVMPLRGHRFWWQSQAK